MDLDALFARLREANARHGGMPVVVYVVYPDGWSELLTMPLESMPRPGGETPGEELRGRTMTDTERDILVLFARAEKPLKGRTVASRLGRSYSSHLRETLAEMVRRGQLLRARGGYWPADRPIPRRDQED
jgi:hypothetical protein